MEERSIAVKLAQAETLRQVEVLHELFMRAPAPIAILEGENRVYGLVNPAYQQIFPERELKGKGILEALPELKNTTINEHLEKVYQTGETFVAHEMPFMLARHQSEPLEECYFNFTLQARRNQLGEIDGILIFVYEVTEQVSARRKIENNEKRISSLLEGIPQMTWTNLPNGNVNFYSKRWFDYTGLTNEQLMGWGWKPIVHPDDLEEMLQLYMQSLEAGTEFKHENRLKGLDGSWRWFLNRSVPLRNESGKPVLWVGTSTDIHEQKEAEKNLHQITQELAAANEELQKANEEIKVRNDELAESNRQLNFINNDLDNFIYTASHDMKAPITNVEGLVEVLLRNLPAEVLELERIQQIARMIQESVGRFKKTIESLTDVAKLQKEHSGETVSVNIAAVVKEVLLDLEPMIRESDVQLEIDVPDCFSIRFSEKNLRLVVYNLLSNAIKYRSQERLPRVEISYQSSKEYDVLVVKDNGVGIRKRSLGQLFTMFKRFHSNVEGTGIGLYMVKKMPVGILRWKAWKGRELPSGSILDVKDFALIINLTMNNPSCTLCY